MKKTSARIAMIGYQFMGRAHANAWRQAGHFCKPALTPELKVVCGRDAKAADEARGHHRSSQAAYGCCRQCAAAQHAQAQAAAAQR